jgi:glutathione S-transferase
MGKPTLYHIHYSPWSERARWALDHHEVPHRRVAHLPMVGELLLRLRARRPFGRVSVPLLVDGRDLKSDSLEIARWAEERGAGAPLFPRDEASEIERVNALAEMMAAAGRARTTARVAADPDALRETLPGPLRAAGSVGMMAGRAATTFLARKYGFAGSDLDAHERILRESLAEIRSALGGRDHFLSDFSYADVAVAASFQFLRPVGEPYIRLGPASARAFTDPLASDHEDLLQWRDRLYRRHR